MPSDNTNESRSEREEARRRRGPPILGWFTATLVRTLVALLGIILLVFAVGQALGVTLLEEAVAFLTTEMGMWLLVALFALMLIIVVVQRGYGYYYR